MKHCPVRLTLMGPRQDLAQADLLLWLAQCLRMPALKAAPSTSQVHALVSATGLDTERTLEPLLRDLVRQIDSISPTKRAAEHHRLFDGAMVCPPNETAYVRRDKGAILGDLCGFYRAFGFGSREDSGDKPDHLAAELEFLAMLLVMLAQAVRTHQHEAAQVTRAALLSFAQDHVDPWLGLFTQRLADTTALPCYVAVAEALKGVWSALVKCRAIPRAGQVPAGEPLTEPEELSACGMTDPPGSVDAVELRVSAPRAASDRPTES